MILLNDKIIKKIYFVSFVRVYFVMEFRRFFFIYFIGREEGGGGCGLLGRIRVVLGRVYFIVSCGFGYYYIISIVIVWFF